ALSGDPAAIGLAAGGLALGLVPGGRLAGRIMKFVAKGGEALGTARDGIKGATRGLGSGGGKTIGGAVPARGLGTNRPPVPKDTSISIDVRKCVTDPVDVATGEMVLAQIDLDLPDPFPYVLERTHLSSYRAGGWFGPTWASTLDQRLEFDAQGVCYFAPDGMILVYPPASPGDTVLPEEGPRWPLTMFANGAAVVTDPSADRSTLFVVSGAVGRLAGVVDGDGNRLEVARDQNQVPVALRHASGQWIAVTTSGSRITALHRTDPAGRPAELIAGYRYDEQGRLVEVDNASGRAVRFRYDDAGRVTGWLDRNGVEYRYTYDASGRCVRTEGADGFLNGALAYDPDEYTTTYTDSLGNVTVYRLDDLRHVASETDPLGNTTRYEWGRYNQLLSRTDPLGRTTRYEYDADGQLRTVIRPDGTEAEVTSGRDAVPPTVAVRAGDRVLTRSYDTLPDPTVSQVGVAEPFDYDRLRADDPVRDAALAGSLTHRVGARGRVERVRYDDEGNPVERTGAAGQVSRTEYGPFDLVLATVDAGGARTSYEYDTELRLTRVTNPRGLQWRYTYDAAGRLVEESDFNGRVRRYEYDAAGQLVRSVNGLGEVTEYDHDVLGNVVERRTASGSTRYRYDAVGRLVAAESADAELVIERDGQGRVVAHTTNGRTLSFRYDDRTGTRHRRTPAGAESVWAYDPFGNLESLVTAGHKLGFRHDWQGRELGRSLDGRVVLEQAFGTDRQLTTQLLPGLRRRFDYRADGLLSGVEDDVTGRIDFALDAAGRVVGVHGVDRHEEYRYDEAGNLASARVSGLPHCGDLRYAGNLVIEAGAVRYRYDAEGRMVRRTLTDPAGADRTWHFEWDAHDRLVVVLTPAGDRWRYRYDPLGRRIAKLRYTASDDTNPVERVDFVWDGTLLVEQAHTDEHGRTRVTTWEYHPQEQHPVAQSVRDEISARFFAIVTDLVGTPTDLVDPDGHLAWRNDTSLWGASTAEPGLTPLRFPGQYLDPETGLHYNVYRYYDPVSGRYVSQDPLGLAPAPDPAGYVPNPYAASDPLGLICTAGSASQIPASLGGAMDAGRASDTAAAVPDPLSRVKQQPVVPAERTPGVTFHGSSVPPEIKDEHGLPIGGIFHEGLVSSNRFNHMQAVKNNTPLPGDPHYDLAKHQHNGNNSGFISTTGNPNVALQFVRPAYGPQGEKIFRDGPLALFDRFQGKQPERFEKHEGFIYAIDTKDLPLVHAPSQNYPGLDHMRYQDEFAAFDHIGPERIIGAFKVDHHYNAVSVGNNGLNGIGINHHPNEGFSMQNMIPNRRYRPGDGSGSGAGS
ncbi:DUF6531 domain-containing protein, partial [Micromonospora sp. NPDC049366]|uniref:DUF6531 domain-containing protein n=1 Tax=Micromonospora sp. NPDC049366 TaxID=3364271 RepID=UPI003796787C